MYILVYLKEFQTLISMFSCSKSVFSFLLDTHLETYSNMMVFFYINQIHPSHQNVAN